jgi:hypothetical protein
MYNFGNMKKPSAKRMPIVNKQGTDDEMLENLQRETLVYFIQQSDPDTGLVTDKSQPGSAASIASVGMALTCYVASVESKLLPRADALYLSLKVLRFLHKSAEGPQADATGYKGFYYHFLDMKTGRRAEMSELSTIDTAILMAGILTVRQYFSAEDTEEIELRKIADDLYRRVDWQWALNGGKAISHGWNPESGFLPYSWDTDYCEALILYTLALGSPTFPIPADSYNKWTATFKCKKIYDIKYLYAGTLFIHQMSHFWIDFKGINDAFNRKAGFDYFENSKRATIVQQQYAIKNPHKFKMYGKNAWGFTASDGPGDIQMEVDGVKRRFYGYTARGIPFGPDDGTISPWAVVASLPFAPKIVLKTLRHAIEKLDLKKHRDGFDASFNPTYPEKTDNKNGWVAPWKFGINQGPIIIMIENYKTGLIWSLMKECPYIINGLRNAGFTGGWLER